MVKELRQSMKLESALKYLELAKSSYFYKRRDKRVGRNAWPLDQSLEEALQQMSGYELTLGYDKTTAYLRKKHGQGWNRKKVYRHMKALGMLQPRHIKRRWRQNKRLGVGYAEASTRRWEADLTYVPTRMGTLYLFVIQDVYDKEVVGDYIAVRCGAEQAIEALREALRKRCGQEKAAGMELTVRVDRGCQFTAEAFAAYAASCGIHLEFCGVQTPNDKPHIESFIGCYKQEEVYRNDYESFFEAYEGWKQYVVWYNTARPHGSLENQSPAEFIGRQHVSTISA